VNHSHRFSFRRDPPPKGNVYKVVTWHPGYVRNVIVLAETFIGLDTHYGNHRTHPCTKPTSACPGHLAQWPIRWKGYLFVKEPSVSRPFFLGLTPGSVEELKDAAQGKVSMRGMIVNVSRTGKHKNAPLQVQYVGEYQGEEPLPTEQDVMPTLLRIWGLDGTY
jgi:hypothetical protein